MHLLTPNRRNALPERPFWLRVVALLALLLISTASTVQVCHAHDVALHSFSQPGSSGSIPGSPAPHPSSPEDHCALCVAMHSALPATSHVELGSEVLFAKVSSTAAEAERLFRWRFELLSRPPPALQS